MNGLNICVNTQTPLVTFNATQEELAKKYGWSEQPLSLDMLNCPNDYRFTTGGVTRMVLPLLQGLVGSGIVDNVHWVCLNPTGPRIFRVENGITLHHVSIEKEQMQGYGKAKEVMWNTLHGATGVTGPASEMLWQEEFSDYTYYNRRTAEEIMKLDREHDFDLFYIHDFQQLPIGSMLHTLKPKVFRWHIPFDESTIPTNWIELLSTYLESYDSIIVSGNKYLKTLRRFGYRGHADYVYPYIDPEPYRKPTVEESRRFRERFGIQRQDKVVLIVARLDPIKGHDKAIIAAAEVLKNHPEMKLMIIGDGGFSSSKMGIGLSKANVWTDKLSKLAQRLKISDRIVFTGYLSQEELNAAYDRCCMTVLPSVREGFGLVVIESWLFHKPTIVTSRAGISELISHGENGLLTDPEEPESLAAQINSILNDRKLARRLGAKGHATSSICLIDRGVEAEAGIISRYS